jgi:hypothetical protein
MIETLEDLTAHYLAHGLNFKESDAEIPDLFYWLWKMNVVWIVDLDPFGNVNFKVRETFWYDYDSFKIRSSTAYVAGMLMDLRYNKYDKKYKEMRRVWTHSNL